MYVQISQPDLDENLANFNMGIDPGLPLAVYTKKQEHCQVFALNTAVPISKDYGMAQVEPLRHCRPHLAQLENPFDISLHQNA